MADTDFIEVEEVTSLNNLQVYQQDKALIDRQIATAKAYPRNLNQAIKNAITIVTMDKETAEKCTYSIKKGGKAITGASVYLAKIVAQQLGNIRIENRVVGYDATHVTCEAICFDLERNFAIRTQIKRSIVGNSGRYTEDMCTIVGNAGNSIALRNAIFAVVDAAIVNKIYKAAVSTITGDISTEDKFTARLTTIVNGFKAAYTDFKLTDLEIAQSVGKEALSSINEEDLLTLIGYSQNLKSGEQKFETIFRPSSLKPSTVKAKAEDKSEDRIIKLIESSKNKEDLIKLKPDATTNKAMAAYDKAFAKFK